MRRMLLAPFAGLFLSFLLSACVAEIAAVGTALTVAGQAVTTTANAAAVVAVARTEVRAAPTLEQKLNAFRDLYCAEAELRLQARADLESVLTTGGVPAEDAALKVSTLKKFGDRVCPPPPLDGGG